MLRRLSETKSVFTNAKAVARRILAVGLVTVLSVGVLSGCGNTAKNGKVTITIGAWPAPEAANYEMMEAQRAEFMKMYPDIMVETDTYTYDVSSFVAKAASKQLPTLYHTHFTEVEKIINNKFARAITKQASDYDCVANMNPSLTELVQKDGELYGIPRYAYAMGLFVNEKLFKDAGLVNSDGSIQVPSTYEELAVTAQIIKEKTGKAGFMMSTTNNCGGWHFMNIAWSNGVKFMEEKDGKWIATFNSQECVDSLQYVKDLRWKYDALTSNVFVDGLEIQKLFASGEAAMIFLNPPGSALSSTYGMDKESIEAWRMPAGKDGRYSQLGGTVYMIEPSATDEQVEAVMKWLEYVGVLSQYNDIQIKSWKDTANQTVASGGFVLPKEAFPIWVNDERNTKYEESIAEYVNVDEKNFADYYGFDDVVVKVEEPESAQQLYGLLDACIQEVLTNENADPAALIEQAAKDFQKNYLDKV